MKKTGFKHALFVLPLLASLFLVGCADSIDSASTTFGVDKSGDDSVALNDNDGKSDKDRRKEVNGSSTNENSTNENSTNENSADVTTPSSVKDFGDDFIRGFDASAVDYFENVYAVENSGWNIKTKCTDSTGEKDIFNLLADHGFNTVRLRVWVDPSETSGITDEYWPTSTSGENWRIGDCTKERAARLAKRAKSAGMKVLLDLHLSDYWTDPSVQLIPKSWRDITSSDEMAEKLSSYIEETLQYMKNSDATPDYVQVGNEIDRGILVDSAVDGTTPLKTPTAADSLISGGITTDNFKKYIKVGCKAVRDFDSSIKIVIHITAKNSERFSNIVSSGVDYDIVGLSYYPWENHGTISELKTKIEEFKTTKDVWIVETSSPAKTYGDDFETHMTRAATNLGSEYSDVTIADGKLVPSEDSQKAVLRHIMQETYDAGGKGICVWGGERRDYQYGLFDWDGRAYKAIDAFNYKPVDGYTADSSDDSDSAGEEENDGTQTTEENMPYTATTSELTEGFEKTYTSSGNGDLFISSDSFTDLDSDGTLTVKAVWASGSSSNWIGWCKGIEWGGSCEWNSTENANVATVSVSDVKTTGLGLKSENGASYTVTVTYSAPVESGSESSSSEDESTETTVTLYAENTVSGNSETVLLSSTALDFYSSGTVTVSGTWVSGSSSPGIMVDGTWNKNLWNGSTNSNSQTFELSEIKGKTLGINMYSDDTSYKITVTITYTSE